MRGWRDVGRALAAAWRAQRRADQIRLHSEALIAQLKEQA